MYEPHPEDLLGYVDDNGQFIKLPTHMEVCPGCHGKGSHVNRAIDGNGLDPHDPDLDEDFWDDYRSGVYDVTCDTCHGRNVVEAVDEERCSPEDLERWHAHCQDAWETHAMWRAEVRAGC
jgi:hypothetical protein